MRAPMAVSLGACAILLGLDALLARLAVEHRVAAALLSPAGLDDPLAWCLAGGFLLARIGGAAAVCAAAALLAAEVAARLVRRIDVWS